MLASGELDGDDMTMSIPAQLPAGVKLETVQSQVKGASTATIALSVVQIVFQICLKGSIEKIMNLLYYMQLTKAITFY